MLGTAALGTAPLGGRRAAVAVATNVGTAASTGAGAAAALTATENQTATLASTAKGPAEAATATENQVGTLASTPAGPAGAATATENQTGTLASTATGPAEAATVTESQTGTAASAATGPAEAATAINVQTGTAASTGAGASEAGTGILTDFGTAGSTAAGGAEGATATESQTGTAASIEGPGAEAATAVGPQLGTAASIEGPGSEAATATESQTGTAASTPAGGAEAAGATESQTGTAASVAGGAQEAGGNLPVIGTMASTEGGAAEAMAAVSTIYGTAESTEGGASEQSVGALPPAGQPFAVFRQDVTIFSPEDDLTPLVGSADGAGVPIVPSFSTDGAHVRPWMKALLNAGGADIDFRAGTATVQQATVEIVDKRLTASDQNTGLFTQLAATAAGDTALLGVRCIVRQLAPDGVTMETLLDGVIYKVLLDDRTLVTYQIVLRDIRERERKARLFVKADKTAFFPVVGPADGYAWKSAFDATDPARSLRVGFPVFPPVQGLKCLYKWSAPTYTGPGPIGYLVPQYDTEADLKLWAAKTARLEQTWAAFGEVHSTGAALGNSAWGAPFGYPLAIMDWSKVGPSGPWKTIVAPPAFAETFQGQETFEYYGGPSNLFEIGTIRKNGTDYRVPTRIRFDWPTTAPDNPGDGWTGGAITMWVRYRSNKAPTTDVPLWIEGNAGQILKDAYDGVYSPAGLGPNVRYDAQGMTDFIRRSPYLYGKITEPAEDAKAWLAPNIYRILGEAPAIRNGKLYPISGDMPAPDVVLPILDNTVVYAGKATWEHGSELIVNNVTFKYERDLIPTDYSTTGVILTQQVTIQRDRVSSNNRHGAKPIVYEPVTARTVRAFSPSAPPSADTSVETGTSLGLARAEAAIRRFYNGAQLCTAECRASLVVGIQPGDWVIMAVTWLPDYQTRKRGINRLMQVTKVEKPSPIVRRFTLVDAGPADQPVAAPTMGVITDNGDSTLSVPLTAFPSTLPLNYKGILEFAFGETQPATTSGEWKQAGSGLSAAGTATTPKLPSGFLVWLRVKGVADGVRASAPSAPVSYRMPSVAVLRDADLSVNPWNAAVAPGQPRVIWTRLTSAGGVRVKYERFAAGAAIPSALSLSLDVDASTGFVDLPITLNQREQVVATVTPYTGFAAGAVTGTAGVTSMKLVGARVDYPYIEPSVAEEQSRSATVGTLTLVPSDPQLQITRYMIRTRTGNLGTWTAYVSDTASPFGGSVSLVTGESSAVGYQIYALDENGVERLVQAADVEFSAAGTGTGVMLLRTTLKTTGTDATHEAWTVESIAPDGSRGAVTLVSITGSASAFSGPSIGVATTDGGSGVDYVFNRGTSGGSDGGALFRATKTGNQSDDDTIVIPAQDKDTLGLAVQLRPVLSTDPTQAWADLVVTDPTGSASAVTVTFTYQGMTGVTVAGSSMATGGTLSATPGSAYRVVMPRGAFGTPVGRLMAAGVRTGILSDSDMVDVAPQDRDTINPTFLENPAETATLGTLVLTPVDPQGRLGTVEFRTYSGLTLVQDWTVVAVAAGTYTQTVPLVPQQTSRIEYRYKATPAGGGAAVLVDGNSIRYGIGGRPLVPELTIAGITADGILSVTAAGDSSTNTVRIAIGLDAPPSQDVLEGVTAASSTQSASGAIAARQGSFTFPLNLLPGQKYFVVAAGYNTALGGTVRSQASDLAGVDGTWTGLSASPATVRVTGPLTPGAKTISLPIVLSAQTPTAEVYVREFKADPGAAQNVTRTGYRLAVIGGSQTVDVPVSSPQNYFWISVRGIDALNRTGATQVYAVDLDGHTVNLKVRAASAATVPPSPPSALSGTTAGSPLDDVVLSVTLPGSNLPDTLRVKQNGVTVMDVAVSVLANQVQTITHYDQPPGTYAYQVFGVKAGVQSDTGSPIANVTVAPITLNAPTLVIGAYSIASQGYQVTITPGSGSPVGTRYFLEHQHITHDGFCAATGTGAWVDFGTYDVTSFFRSHGNNYINGITENVRVTATKAGYTSSVPSATQVIAIPNVNGSYCPP